MSRGRKTPYELDFADIYQAFNAWFSPKSLNLALTVVYFQVID